MKLITPTLIAIVTVVGLPFSAQAQSYGNTAAYEACEKRDDSRQIRGALLGAVLGGVIGNQVKNGDGTPIGAVAGAAAGAKIGDKNCDEYNGPQYREGYRSETSYGTTYDNGQLRTVSYDGGYVVDGVTYRSTRQVGERLDVLKREEKRLRTQNARWAKIELDRVRSEMDALRQVGDRIDYYGSPQTTIVEQPVNTTRVLGSVAETDRFGRQVTFEQGRVRIFDANSGEAFFVSEADYRSYYAR